MSENRPKRGRPRKFSGRVAISFTAEDIAELDRIAKAEFCSRSEAARIMLARMFAEVRREVLGART